MTVPTFFIIGAPKCGTTSLSAYLADHPEVHFSEPKEPKYFHTDFDERHRTTLTPAEYEHCFAPLPDPPPRAVGEGTVWYLYSRAAVPNILQLNPEAKFIVMVRNPIELAHSLHAQFVYGGYEDIADFERAWHRQGTRRQAGRLPLLCPDRKLLLYGEVAALGSQLERLFALAPPGNVHVVVFDDFVRDTRACYARLLAFLSLSPHDVTIFEQRNRNRAVTRPGLVRLLHRLAGIKRRLGVRRSFGVWGRLESALAQPTARSPLPASFHDELCDYFSDEVALLSRQLQRDLSGWLLHDKGSAARHEG